MEVILAEESSGQYTWIVSGAVCSCKGQGRRLFRVQVVVPQSKIAQLFDLETKSFWGWKLFKYLRKHDPGDLVLSGTTCKLFNNHDFMVNADFTRAATPARVKGEWWNLGFHEGDSFGFMSHPAPVWVGYYSEEEAVRWVAYGIAPLPFAAALKREREKEERRIKRLRVIDANRV